MLPVDTMAREILVGDGVDSVSVWEGNVVCGLTIASFYLLGKLIKDYGRPRFVSADVEFWKWQNIAVSWVHGLVCGGWDLLCLILFPDLLRDPVEYINRFSYLIVPFSAGYFIYDFIDMLQHKKLKEYWEVTLHHIIIVSSFVYNYSIRRCIGYNIIALMAEINSIFLHLRKLLQMCNVGYNTWTFQIVSVANLLTFITFRLLPIGRVYAGLYLDFDRVSKIYITVFAVTLTTGAVINVILFWRLVQSDVIKGWFGKRKSTKVQKNNIVVNGVQQNGVSSKKA